MFIQLQLDCPCDLHSPNTYCESLLGPCIWIKLNAVFFSSCETLVPHQNFLLLVTWRNITMDYGPWKHTWISEWMRERERDSWLSFVYWIPNNDMFEMWRNFPPEDGLWGGWNKCLTLPVVVIFKPPTHREPLSYWFVCWGISAHLTQNPCAFQRMHPTVCPIVSSPYGFWHLCTTTVRKGGQWWKSSLLANLSTITDLWVENPLISLLKIQATILYTLTGKSPVDFSGPFFYIASSFLDNYIQMVTWPNGHCSLQWGTDHAGWWAWGRGWHQYSPKFLKSFVIFK